MFGSCGFVKKEGTCRSLVPVAVKPDISKSALLFLTDNMKFCFLWVSDQLLLDLRNINSAISKKRFITPPYVF